MLKIAVIGGRDTVMGFKALGLDTFPAADSAEAGKILRSITRDCEEEYAIIYIEETFAVTPAPPSDQKCHLDPHGESGYSYGALGRRDG